MKACLILWTLMIALNGLCRDDEVICEDFLPHYQFDVSLYSDSDYELSVYQLSEWDQTDGRYIYQGEEGDLVNFMGVVTLKRTSRMPDELVPDECKELSYWDKVQGISVAVNVDDPLMWPVPGDERTVLLEELSPFVAIKQTASDLFQDDPDRGHYYIGRRAGASFVSFELANPLTEGEITDRRRRIRQQLNKPVVSDDARTILMREYEVLEQNFGAVFVTLLGMGVERGYGFRREELIERGVLRGDYAENWQYDVVRFGGNAIVSEQCRTLTFKIDHGVTGPGIAVETRITVGGRNVPLSHVQNGVATFDLCPETLREKQFVRGDTDQNGQVNLTDVLGSLNYLFLEAPTPGCLDALDTNDDGLIQLTDSVYALNALFLAGQPIPMPYPYCGQDTTTDDLDCARPMGCER